MKRKVLMMIFAVSFALAGCSSKDAESVRGTPSEPVEEPAETSEPEVLEETPPAEEPEEAEAEEPEEEEPPKTYVEEHGLEFYEGTEFTVQGSRHVENDLSDFDFTEVEEKILNISKDVSETEGFEVVTIETSSFGYVGMFGDSQRLVLTVPSMKICDLYTGRLALLSGTMQDAELRADGELEWNGETYSIEYATNIEWDFADWTTDAQGNDVVPSTCYATYTITIPEGYDGLALAVYPVTEGPSETEAVTGSAEVETVEKYIMDDWKDGSYLIRVDDLYGMLGEASE